MSLRTFTQLLLGMGVVLSGCALQGSTPEVAGKSAAMVDGQRALEIHAAALVLDAHADIVAEGEASPYAGPDGRSRVDPASMRAGGMDAVVLSVAVGPGPRTADGYRAARAEAARKLAVVQAQVADPANNLVLARSADELEAAHAAGRLAIMLSLQNALILGTEVDALDTYFDAGVRIFALTHMGHNDFADSSRPLYDAATGRHEADAEHDGLSPLGKAAVARVNALGGVIDVSQLSTRATLQVLALSTAPVIASHSNVRSITHATRNLSDEEIDRIGANGGVIHVTPFRGYLFDSDDATLDASIRAARRDAGLTEDYQYPFELYWEIADPGARQRFTADISALLGPGSIDDMLDHLDYIVRRIGIEHVGIGSDFNHGGGLAGFEDASQAANVTAALLRRGYDAGDIVRIWGGNFLRVLRQAERH